MKEKRGQIREKTENHGMFSADFLKIMALITMLIDHIGAGILEYMMRSTFAADMESYRQIYVADRILRMTGRLSFPLFCFLLVQGFLHTHSRVIYALRLVVFALLSELPFDYLFFGGFTMEHQNVFWTLFLGLVTLSAISAAEETELPRFLKGMAVAGALAAGMLAAGLMNTDYGWRGIIMIAAIYLLRRDRALQCLCTPLLFLIGQFVSMTAGGMEAEIALEQVALHGTVFFSFIFIYRCDGKRNMKRGKYIFYAFYPLHLLLLLLIRTLLLT